MNVGIIEDVKDDGVILIGHLQKYFSGNYANQPINISLYQNEAEFLSVFEKEAFDFLFIDYYLENTTGLELARQIREQDAGVILIFTTRSSDFAIDSYKVKASGYLLKPIVYEELSEIMSLMDCKKIWERQFIEIDNGSQNVKIILRDIIYCDVAGHYTQIHTRSMGVQRFRISLSELMPVLQHNPEFISCYRGCIINMLQIRKITEYNFLMENGEEIPFRKKQKAKILKVYSDFIFERVRMGEENYVQNI